MQMPDPQLRRGHELVMVLINFDHGQPGQAPDFWVLARRELDGAFVTYAMDSKGALTFDNVIAADDEAAGQIPPRGAPGPQDDSEAAQ